MEHAESASCPRPKASAGIPSVSGETTWEVHQGWLMMATGGKLSEASRAVGHHGALPRHEEGSPASGTASGEYGLGWRAAAASAGDDHGSESTGGQVPSGGHPLVRPRGWPGRGDVLLRQRRAVTSGNLEAQAASLHTSPRR